MKAIVVEKPGDADVLQVKEVPKPEPKDKEVCVKIHTIGVNPLETYLRQGIFGPLNLPHILGSDAAGIVDSVGPNASKFKKGDRVWVFSRNSAGKGTYAEYANVSEDYVFPLPEKSSFKDGASLGVPFLTAADALFEVANGQPGETVLVHGASGGVGVPAVQFARAHGMTVIGTASTEEGLKLVKDSGAHFALNHRNDDYLQQIKDITGGKGPNVILEMLASTNLQKDMDMIAERGRIAIIGSRGNIEINPGPILMKSLSVLGVILLTIPMDRVLRNAARITPGLEQGWLRPVVGKEYTMSQAAEAHREQINGKAKGKIIINV